jgi:hypothetical protein
VRALLISCVQIAAYRPNGESFACRIISSSSSHGITESTGPKISSRAIRIELSTFENIVGST